MASSSKISRVTLFGGSGFVGAEIARQLLEVGCAVRIAVRRPELVPADLLANWAPRCEAMAADLLNPASLAAALSDCEAAVNAVGLYVEQGERTFTAVHEDGAEALASQCQSRGIPRLIHLSGIGADASSPSPYVRARGRGDERVRQAFPAATILRPSAVFAPDDKFLNSLAGIVRSAPVIPLFGRGETRLQPVFRGDVAQAVQKALTTEPTPGQVFELGGPKVYSYRQLLELIARTLDRKPLLLPVPFALWDLAAWLLSPLPRPPLTEAQVTLMKSDNVVSPEARSFTDLGIKPKSVEAVLPLYRFAT